MPLRHERAGSGPPLLLLHGIGMSHRAFEDVVPRLAADFECHAVDLPGFGDSPAVDGPATMARLAGACRDFMASRGHERFHVAGNSLGGGVALWLALRGHALTACGLSPIGFTGGWDRAWTHLALMTTKALGPVNARVVPLAGRPGLVRKALLRLYVEHGERLELDRVLRSFGDLERANAYGDARRHAINWRCPEVAELPCPVTVAWSELDRLLLRGPQAARAAERLPTARHVVLHGCGHLPAWDDPAQTAEVIRSAARS